MAPESVDLFVSGRLCLFGEHSGERGMLISCIGNVSPRFPTPADHVCYTAHAQIGPGSTACEWGAHHQLATGSRGSCHASSMLPFPAWLPEMGIHHPGPFPLS